MAPAICLGARRAKPDGLLGLGRIAIRLQGGDTVMQFLKFVLVQSGSELLTNATDLLSGDQELTFIEPCPP